MYTTYVIKRNKMGNGGQRQRRAAAALVDASVADFEIETEDLSAQLAALLPTRGTMKKAFVSVNFHEKGNEVDIFVEGDAPEAAMDIISGWIEGDD